ncbi:unnamed protein product [Prorocentrum cordatum]|uniref:Peptidase C1A papain C-terminal domain-containing protein n=1 Tax=Prorocentrum cordatum TaxID=2364126 RepID=A0ABN9S8J0_9DINO|nr:unnamed protein product [Polarella glacialis]
MDVAPDVATHLGAVSFQTGLPVCLALDAAQQLADDAIVQSSDLVAWAQGVGGGRPGTAAAGLQSGASTDGRRFRMAYLQGLDVRAEWLGAVAAAGSAVVSPPALAVSPCRLLILRTLLLLLNGITPNEAEAEAPKLAQMLLGLDPEPAAGADVDVDAARAAQPMPLDALMALLENPPPVPAQPEGSGGPWPSDGRALRSRGVDQGTSQALEQHAIYEAALGVLLGLFNAPALRDVALRYACHAWPSRYQAVRDLLGLQWEAVAGPLRCLLLSEASLTLQAVSWEMRLVPPAGAPPPRQVLPPSFAAQQRRGHERQPPPPGGRPEPLLALRRGLPGGAQRRALLGEVRAAAGRGRRARGGLAGVGAPAAGDVLRLSRTSLLAVSDAGDAALRLDLHDPHLLLRTLQAGRKWLSATGSPVDPAALSAEEAEMLGAVGASNEAACAAFFSKAASSSLHLFTAAALHHLAAGGARPGALARHPRGQVARAHLEALLPALAAAPGGAPERAELLARLACGFVVAAQQTESPPPRAFVGSLFCALRDMALDPASSPEVRKCTHQALFLVLHRMLPAPQAGPDARLGDHELAALRGLAGALAREAASSHDGAQDGLQDGAAGGSAGPGGPVAAGAAAPAARPLPRRGPRGAAGVAAGGRSGRGAGRAGRRPLRRAAAPPGRVRGGAPLPGPAARRGLLRGRGAGGGAAAGLPGGGAGAPGAPGPPRSRGGRAVPRALRPHGRAALCAPPRGPAVLGPGPAVGGRRAAGRGGRERLGARPRVRRVSRPPRPPRPGGPAPRRGRGHAAAARGVVPRAQRPGGRAQRGRAGPLARRREPVLGPHGGRAEGAPGLQARRRSAWAVGLPAHGAPARPSGGGRSAPAGRGELDGAPRVRELHEGPGELRVVLGGGSRRRPRDARGAGPREGRPAFARHAGEVHAEPAQVRRLRGLRWCHRRACFRVRHAVRSCGSTRPTWPRGSRVMVARSPAWWHRGYVQLPMNEARPLRHALSTEGPVVVSVEANDWFMYGGGIFDKCQIDAEVDHAVLLVGYGHEAGSLYWQIRNSWGYRSAEGIHTPPTLAKLGRARPPPPAAPRGRGRRRALRHRPQPAARRVVRGRPRRGAGVRHLRHPVGLRLPPRRAPRRRCGVEPLSPLGAGPAQPERRGSRWCWASAPERAMYPRRGWLREVFLEPGLRGTRHDMNMSFRRSARSSWIGAPTPLPGLAERARGLQRRSEKSARTCESSCSCHFVVPECRWRCEDNGRSGAARPLVKRYPQLWG